MLNLLLFFLSIYTYLNFFPLNVSLLSGIGHATMRPILGMSEHLYAAAIHNTGRHRC